MSKELTKKICALLCDKKAEKIKIVQIKGMSDIADYFVICSGKSAPQVKAITEHLEESLEQEQIFPKHKEGLSEGKWVCLDYQDVVVHIFHSDIREVYQLDKLWNNGNNVLDYKD
ncbi:MAG: ribosome silencing factor [Clostridia bacterium]